MEKSSWLAEKCVWSLVKKQNLSFSLLSILLPCLVCIIQDHTHTNVISAVALRSFLHSVSFPLLHPSSSQVGIHHHVGGQLTSDSFVNVNYCSLSEPRESATCRAVRRRLRRTQNNQPVFLIPSSLLYLGRPFHSSKHANLTLCLSHLHSGQNCFVTLMLLIALFNFPDNRPSLKASHWFPAYLPVWLKIYKLPLSE